MGASPASDRRSWSNIMPSKPCRPVMWASSIRMRRTHCRKIGDPYHLAIAGEGRLGHVWTAPAMQEGRVMLRGRVQSCVRPVDAALMAAGPDEVPRTGSRSVCRASKRLRHYGLIPFPARPGSSSHLTTLAHPGRHCCSRPGETTGQAPGKTVCARAPSRRSGRSCWRARRTRAWRACAPAALPPRPCPGCSGAPCG